MYVICYSSNKEELHATHVRHRKFTTWVKAHTSFKLVSVIKNAYPFNPEDDGNTSFADFYIFEKK